VLNVARDLLFFYHFYDTILLQTILGAQFEHI